MWDFSECVIVIVIVRWAGCTWHYDRFVLETCVQFRHSRHNSTFSAEFIAQTCVFTVLHALVMLARLFELQLDQPQHLCHRWSHSSTVLAVLHSSTPKNGSAVDERPKEERSTICNSVRQEFGYQFQLFDESKKTVADLQKTLHHHRLFHLPALAHGSINSFLLFLAGLHRNTALQNVIGSSGDI